MLRNISTAALLCVAVTALVMGQKIAKDLDDAISEASIWVGWKSDDSLYPKQDGKKALEDGKTCIDKIDEARSKGLAASPVVETQKGKMTSTEARDLRASDRHPPQHLFRTLTHPTQPHTEPLQTCPHA